METDLAGVSTPKSEWEIALRQGLANNVFTNNPTLYKPSDDVRMAFSFSLLRDSSATGTAELWKFYSPTGGQEMTFLATAATFGLTAGIDVPEDILENMVIEGIATRADYVAMFDLANTLSPHLADTSPVGEVGVFYSEAVKNEYYVSGDRAIWENVNSASIGAFEAFSDLGLSPVVVNDNQFDAGIPSNIKVLFVPEIAQLSSQQQAVLAAFSAGGGEVIYDDPSSQWGTAAGYASAVSAIKLSPSLSSLSVIVHDLPDGIHAASYSKQAAGSPPSLTIAVTNTFTHLQSSNPWGNATIPPGLINPDPPPVAAGITVEIDPAFFGVSGAVEAENFHVYESVSGQRLNVAVSNGKAFVELPSFELLSVIVVNYLG